LDYNPEADMHGFLAGILHWKLVTAYVDANFLVHTKRYRTLHDCIHQISDQFTKLFTNQTRPLQVTIKMKSAHMFIKTKKCKQPLTCASVTALTLHG
jgi:hypothetical protein